jgi:wobble nucleotide-excising tRNase
MIKKIKKIKKLGVFSDFEWDVKLSDFGRYNLIYGLNGSGKTTLSNLMAGLPSASVSSYPDLEYELETEAGTVRTDQPLPVKVRVFNRDYVANNVHRISGRARPILILGEENKKIADEIAADETALSERRRQIAKFEERSSDVAKRRGKIFSDIAKTIGMNTSGLATRTYRKPEAEKDFASLSSKALLDDLEVAANVAELKQQEKPDVAAIRVPRLRSGQGDKLLSEFLNMLSAAGTDLCSQTVESKLIDRLKQNADIAQWIERGIALHEAHASRKCEFCEQTLPPARMMALAAHFNEADRKLKNEIDCLLKLLVAAEQTIHGLQFPDKANLYDELQVAYQTSVERFAAAKEALLVRIASFRASMEEKKAKTTEIVALVAPLEAADLIACIEAANAEIKKHNGKTADFKALKEAARKKLEAHYLSTVFDEVKTLEHALEHDRLEIVRLNDGDSQGSGAIGVAALAERIEVNRAKISSTHKGCQDINDALKTFLGRDELQFKVDEDGYVLMRGKKVAENLSEGERTAIGFVHFVIHLEDADFDRASGIIVVDDPVSSLDSNSMFQAFAFLKNAVQDAKQIFLMTHNFDFLRLLVNWTSHIPHSKQRCKYYMIKNSCGRSGDRVASLETLDRLLYEHESEYHYLFKLLYTFQGNGTIESVYHVPNIARKLLDTFLMFRVPNNAKPYHKLQLLRPYFDENKLTAIYKFTNDQSHITGKGFDPSLVSETQKNVANLLEMIKEVFPEHYKILVDSVGPIAAPMPTGINIPVTFEPEVPAAATN